MESDNILEKQFWGTLIKVPEWGYMVRAFRRRKEKLNKDTCIAVRDKKMDEAIRCQAKAEEVDTLIRVIEARIDELKIRR